MVNIAKFLLPTKYQSNGKTPLSPPPDGSPLSHMPAMLPPEDSLVEGDTAGKRRRIRWRFFCYFLHILLVGLHIVLLVIAVLNHMEHRFTIPFDNEVFTTGLSGALQAFYTLYTALLVFVVQGLVLSALFSSPKKLAEIHDICGAWNGLGAALNALWSQTKVKSSVFSIVLVTAYLACVSVLHVASSTIMQFQPFNNTVTMMVPALKMWPGQSANLSAVDWNVVLAPLSFLQSLYGNTTSGLAGTTLYDVPTQSFVGAMVNATTVNAHCGLLTNFSFYSNPINVGPIGEIGIHVSMSDLDPFTISVAMIPLSNEIWFSPFVQCVLVDTVPSNVCQSFIGYVVSAAIETGESANGINPVHLNGSYDSPSKNTSTDLYFVACSLDATTHSVNLGPSGSQVNLEGDSMDLTWPVFSPSGDTNLTSTILAAITSVSTNYASPYCQPSMSSDVWHQISPIHAYMSSLSGLGQTSCSNVSINPVPNSGAPLTYYTGSPSLLTRGQMEAAVSQIATELIWIAGELGEAGGGFDRQTEESQVTQYILEWRLNINLLPVITALCASVILCLLVVYMLWEQNSQALSQPASAIGVLEMMWLGSQSEALHDHLRQVENPLLDSLRAMSIFEKNPWMYPTNMQLESEESAEPHDHTELVFGNSPTQHIPLPADTCQSSPSHLLCYTLHIILVALHVVLLVLLTRHPEHSVVIPIESGVLTTGLSAFLQAIYTLYSALLLYITQRLALFRIIGKQQKLTTVHDVSGAWTGMGSAIYVLWQQLHLRSSVLEIASVVAYLASMLILHIGSSSVMQWQAFNSTIVDVLPSDLAFPGNFVDISQLSWSIIFPIIQSMGENSSLSMHGLWNNMIYDIPRVPTNVTFSQVSVNATMVDVQCGLVPNLTLSVANLTTGPHWLNFSLNGNDNGSFDVLELLWKDTVYQDSASPGCAACSPAMFFMITTGIEVDDSVPDTVTVNTNWTYTPPGGKPETSKTSTHLAACSADARTVPAALDLQDYQLVSPTEQSNSSDRSTWSVWSPGNATNFSVGMASLFRSAEEIIEPVGSFPDQPDDPSIIFTEFDKYMMSLLGLDIVAEAAASATQSSANPSVILRPSQLENAIAQVATKFLWVAGQLGESAGGFQRTVGGSRATRNVLQWRLNLNAIPIMAVSTVSLVALILVPFIIGKKPSKEHIPLVSGTSVLECLWLEAHSEVLHSRLQVVEEPRSEKLRVAGMFDICLGEIGRNAPDSQME